MEEGFGCKANTEKALKWYKKAADAGHREAQNRLNILNEKKPAKAEE